MATHFKDAQRAVMDALGSPFPGGALSTFLAIHATGTVSAAAERLQLSQSAVSRRLQGLELQLGEALFERLPGRLLLTAAGRALLPHAQRALAAESEALRAVREQRDDQAGSLAIGSVGSLVELYLTKALRRVVEHHPGVEIDVTTASSSQVQDFVRKGEVDLGVSYAQPGDDELEVEVLLVERLVAVCAPSHPAAQTGLRERDVRDHRWLVFPDHAAYPDTSRGSAQRVLAQYQVAPRRLRPVDSFSAQRALAIAGYGLALLPERVVTVELQTGRLTHVDAPFLCLDAPVTLITRRHARRAPAAAKLFELLRD